MTRTNALAILSCLTAVSLLSSPALAVTLQNPDEASTASTAKIATQKTRPAVTRPAAGKTTTAAPKVASTPAKKNKDKPGKRFWDRIMSSFREVHSVEKKMNK